MSAAVIEPLIADMLQWIDAAPRTYDEVMAVWRTSCPRLTVWEDAVDRGLVRVEARESGGIGVAVTWTGRALLAAHVGPAGGERTRHRDD